MYYFNYQGFNTVGLRLNYSLYRWTVGLVRVLTSNPAQTTDATFKANFDRGRISVNGLQLFSSGVVQFGWLGLPILGRKLYFFNSKNIMKFLV